MSGVLIAYRMPNENRIWPRKIIYPNGRAITYDFGSDCDCPCDPMGRVTAIRDGDQTLAAYTYLGLA